MIDGRPQWSWDYTVYVLLEDGRKLPCDVSEKKLPAELRAGDKITVTGKLKTSKLSKAEYTYINGCKVVAFEHTPQTTGTDAEGVIVSRQETDYFGYKRITFALKGSNDVEYICRAPIIENGLDLRDHVIDYRGWGQGDKLKLAGYPSPAKNGKSEVGACRILSRETTAPGR